MNPFETKFERLITAKLNEAYSKSAEGMATGGFHAFEKYREEVGYVRGLKAALKFVSEVRAELQRD